MYKLVHWLFIIVSFNREKFVRSTNRFSRKSRRTLYWDIRILFFDGGGVFYIKKKVHSIKFNVAVNSVLKYYYAL